ncbi:septal ring lytic transglycosylase RlpA family protein [Microscilla marina]|uniref:Probable endolytic peptidoglycan transglycosylase RlpA n=1 Tax=Microscilla marina ATCC 23134 TaxID=313606 RepID=A1ZM47_MICM2|nr:septal ring lytic transglycosylase RlpA family protein [Microscilla marina]EAY28579.1 RlpA protein [Microscilla marina ATCC 23134]
MNQLKTLLVGVFVISLLTACDTLLIATRTSGGSSGTRTGGSSTTGGGSSSTSGGSSSTGSGGSSSNVASVLNGKASYYHDKFHGRRTASGQTYNKYALTAAHKTLPFNTKIEVRNLKNNRKVLVVINDRLPRTSTRSIDLSRAAAERIGMVRDGVVRVEMKVLRR